MNMLLFLLIAIPVAILGAPANESMHWLEMNLNSNLDLIEGDIIPNEDRYVTRYKNKRWTDNKVYYRFATSSPNNCHQTIVRALQSIMQQTGNCVTFHHDPHGNHVNRLEYFSGAGCYSYVGMQGGAQKVSIKNQGCCHEYIIQHETFHALGFFHEHNRYDRDSYLNIYWQDIITSMYSQFKKKSLAYGDPLGEQFDYKSIMLYRSTAFTKNGQVTMLKKNGQMIYDNTRLSPVDIRKLKKFYGCS